MSDLILKRCEVIKGLLRPKENFILSKAVYSSYLSLYKNCMKKRWPVTYISTPLFIFRDKIYL